MERTFVTPGPEGLRALSHPGRLRMLGLLRAEGPATATSLATRLGLNTGATSYHLRQLAQHGFVVEDPERGNGRERWWKAAHSSTHVDASQATTEEEQDTAGAFLQSVAVVYSENLQRAVMEERSLPLEWQRAGDLSDWRLQLTPARAHALVQALHEVIETWPEEDDDPAARPFALNLNAYLRPGSLE